MNYANNPYNPSSSNAAAAAASSSTANPNVLHNHAFDTATANPALLDTSSFPDSNGQGAFGFPSFQSNPVHQHQHQHQHQQRLAEATTRNQSPAVFGQPPYHVNPVVPAKRPRQGEEEIATSPGSNARLLGESRAHTPYGTQMSAQFPSQQLGQHHGSSSQQSQHHGAPHASPSPGLQSHFASQSPSNAGSQGSLSIHGLSNGASQSNYNQMQSLGASPLNNNTQQNYLRAMQSGQHLGRNPQSSVGMLQNNLAVGSMPGARTSMSQHQHQHQQQSPLNNQMLEARAVHRQQLQQHAAHQLNQNNASSNRPMPGQAPQSAQASQESPNGQPGGRTGQPQQNPMQSEQNFMSGLQAYMKKHNLPLEPNPTICGYPINYFKLFAFLTKYGILSSNSPNSQKFDLVAKLFQIPEHLNQQAAQELKECFQRNLYPYAKAYWDMMQQRKKMAELQKQRQAGQGVVTNNQLQSRPQPQQQPQFSGIHAPPTESVQHGQQRFLGQQQQLQHQQHQQSAQQITGQALASPQHQRQSTPGRTAATYQGLNVLQPTLQNSQQLLTQQSTAPLMQKGLHNQSMQNQLMQSPQRLNAQETQRAPQANGIQLAHQGHDQLQSGAEEELNQKRSSSTASGQSPRKIPFEQTGKAPSDGDVDQVIEAKPKIEIPNEHLAPARPKVKTKKPELRARHPFRTEPHRLLEENELLRKSEELKIGAPSTFEMGVVDIHALIKSLESRLHAEVRYALDQILQISYDPQVYVDLRMCGDLLEALVDLAEGHLETLLKFTIMDTTKPNTPNFDQIRREARLENNGFSCSPSKFASNDSQLDNAADQLVCVMDILQNFSWIPPSYSWSPHLVGARPQSQPHQSNHGMLVSMATSFLSRSLSAVRTRPKLLRSAQRTQDFMKTAVMFLANVAHEIILLNKTNALTLLLFLIAFTPTMPGVSGNQFRPYDSKIDTHLPFAIHALAKLLARDDPNRTYLRSILSSDSDLPVDCRLATHAFALATSAVPVNWDRKETVYLLESSPARCTILIQGLIAADILSSFNIGNDGELAKFWLESDDAWAPGLLGLALEINQHQKQEALGHIAVAYNQQTNHTQPSRDNYLEQAHQGAENSWQQPVQRPASNHSFRYSGPLFNPKMSQHRHRSRYPRPQHSSTLDKAIAENDGSRDPNANSIVWRPQWNNLVLSKLLKRNHERHVYHMRQVRLRSRVWSYLRGTDDDSTSKIQRQRRAQRLSVSKTFVSQRFNGLQCKYYRHIGRDAARRMVLIVVQLRQAILGGAPESKINLLLRQKNQQVQLMHRNQKKQQLRVQNSQQLSDHFQTQSKEADLLSRIRRLLALRTSIPQTSSLAKPNLAQWNANRAKVGVIRSGKPFSQQWQQRQRQKQQAASHSISNAPRKAEASAFQHAKPIIFDRAWALLARLTEKACFVDDKVRVGRQNFRTKKNIAPRESSTAWTHFSTIGIEKQVLEVLQNEVLEEEALRKVLAFAQVGD